MGQGSGSPTPAPSTRSQSLTHILSPPSFLLPCHPLALFSGDPTSMDFVTHYEHTETAPRFPDILLPMLASEPSVLDFNPS